MNRLRYPARMHDFDHYRRQAAGCRRLRDTVADPELAAAIDALARRYDSLAALWPLELTLA